MSDENIPLGTTPLPEHCHFVGSDKILCVYGEESVECKVLGDNKFVCGEEKKECEFFEGELGCKVMTKPQIVDINPEGKEKPDLFLGHIYLVVVVAILSLALTQILKPFIWKTCSEKSDAVIRLVSVLTGVVIAISLSNPLEMIDVYLGASAGAINAFVFKMFKAKVKKSLGVESTPDPQDKGDEDE
jgi:hypothetical protein